MKKCWRCHKTKPYAEYHKDQTIKDGYRNRCRACRKILAREYRTKNIVAIRKRLKEKYDKAKDQVFDKYGRQCVRCGFKDIRALQVDHVNGGGGRMRRRFSGRTHYESILNDTKTQYQVLCANCNWIKRWENNEK